MKNHASVSCAGEDKRAARTGRLHRVLYKFHLRQQFATNSHSRTVMKGKLTMKKTITTAIMAAMLAAPAMAGSLTLSFANSDGNTTVMTFDQESMTATIEGAEGSFPYTWDEATKTLCGDATGEGEVCATIESTSETPAVGDTSAYTSSDGGSGTVTITAMAE